MRYQLQSWRDSGKVFCSHLENSWLPGIKLDTYVVSSIQIEKKDWLKFCTSLYLEYGESWLNRIRLLFVLPIFKYLVFYWYKNLRTQIANLEEKYPWEEKADSGRINSKLILILHLLNDPLDLFYYESNPWCEEFLFPLSFLLSLVFCVPFSFLHLDLFSFTLWSIL